MENFGDFDRMRVGPKENFLPTFYLLTRHMGLVPSFTIRMKKKETLIYSLVESPDSYVVSGFDIR